MRLYPSPLAAATQDLDAGRVRAHALKVPELRRTVALVAGTSTIAPHALWGVNALIREVSQELVSSGNWPGAAWIGHQLRQGSPRGDSFTNASNATEA